LKLQWMVALLITGTLVMSAVAQERPVPAGSHDETYRQQSGDNGQATITVDVWSSAIAPTDEETESQAAKLSLDFAPVALTAAFRMQSTERKIQNSIRRGFPIGEFWIQTDLDAINNSLALARLSATNGADREALQQLENQANRLRAWCDWLIDTNQKLGLADYYVSPSVLDNDEQFQSALVCTRFLISMLASTRLAENSLCP